MKLKNDKFRKKRGGQTKLLVLSCGKCGHFLLNYQKDGLGMLKRLYLDRIVGSRFSPTSKLHCSKCRTLIAIPIVYKKENRRALRLFAGAVSKKIGKLA